MSARLSAQIAPSDTGAGYFGNLPRYALPTLQAAFDRVMTRQYKSQAIHTGLKKDLLELGVEAPSFSVLNEWIESVLHGRIERPLGPIENSSASAEGGEVRADEAAQPEPFSLLTPTDWLQAKKTTPNALSELVARAIDEKAAALRTDARRYAQLLIAEQLRELADELEASGS